MRYKIIFPVEGNPTHFTAALEDSDLARAIDFARRISEGDWYEVVDTRTGNVVASSDSERRG